MKITVTYGDGTAVEHEVDGASYITIEGPARNGEGSLVGRWNQTFPFTKPQTEGPPKPLPTVSAVAVALETP